MSAVERRHVLGAAGLLGLAGCSPADLLNALAGDDRVQKGLPYGPDPRQVLDVYRPAGPGPHPMLVFLYGGNWTSGTRALYRFVGEAYAGRGFVTVIPDYRLFPQVRFPTFVQDCALAFAWARREGARFGAAGQPWLMGHSAGAYNAAMLALDPQYLGAVGLAPRADIRGLIGLAGPYDFLPLRAADLREIFGAGPDGMAAPQTQPIHFAANPAPPMLLLAGRDDEVVDPGNSTRLARAVQAAGGYAQTRFYPHLGHRTLIGSIAPPLHFLAPTWRDTLAFMNAG